MNSITFILITWVFSIFVSAQDKQLHSVKIDESSLNETSKNFQTILEYSRLANQEAIHSIQDLSPTEQRTLFNIIKILKDVGSTLPESDEPTPYSSFIFPAITNPNAITGFGNSGSGLLCTFPTMTVVRLRDLIENEQNYFTLYKKNHRKNLVPLINMALNQIKIINPKLYQEVIYSFQLLRKNLTFHNGQHMSPLNDTETWSFSQASDCQEVLIAKAIFGPLEYDNVFVVDLLLYEAMETNLNKAALWIHEALYLTYRLKYQNINAQKSFVMRRIVAEIFKDNPNRMLLATYLGQAFIPRNLPSAHIAHIAHIAH